MSEGEFIPFVARRAAELTPEPAGPERTDDAAAREDPSANDTVQAQPEAALEPEAPSDAEAVDAASDCADSSADVVPTPGEPAAPTERPCDHSQQIRNEAVRLAAIACGRALRHAVMLHPGIIAAFVADALAAAGHPAQARIRLHPDSIAAVEVPHHDLIADEACAPGDVIIECEDTSVGATVLERAELLANAAAG